MGRGAEATNRFLSLFPQVTCHPSSSRLAACLELHNLLFCYQRYHLHLVHRSVWAGVSSPGRAMCLPCRSSYSGTSKCPSGAVWLGDS
uniref:Uncharacterized protein n=1 Tax=Cairina moschata TaxID=8855 RepID=A0A8C3BIR4_CAIMO